MVFPNLGSYTQELQSIQKGFISEATTFRTVYTKTKASLPQNKFIGTVNKVLKHLKYLSNLNFIYELNCKQAKVLSKPLDSTVWCEVLEVCVLWATHLCATSDSCMNAVAHCEQNIKIGHVLLFYVSLLAILARLHALAKALCLTIVKLAYSIKVELARTSASDQLDQESVNNIKKELLAAIGLDNNFDRLLRCDIEGRKDFEIPENLDDIGEPISRTAASNNDDEIDTYQSSLEKKLKAAKSVHSLRILCKSQGDFLSAKKKEDAEKVLQETDKICKSLLNAKKMVIYQTAQLLSSLMLDSKYVIPGTSPVSLSDDTGNGCLKSEEIEEEPKSIKRLMKSLPCKGKIRKICLSSLPNMCKKKKKSLMKVIKAAKPKLLALKENGSIQEYKKQVSKLVTNIKQIIATKGSSTIQDVHPLEESSIETPLLDTSEDFTDETTTKNKKLALEKALKSCKTMDDLLVVWNDVLVNEREDLSLLLPANIKKSKLVCIKKNIMNLKIKKMKPNMKTTVRKIISFIYK